MLDSTPRPVQPHSRHLVELHSVWCTPKSIALAFELFDCDLLSPIEETGQPYCDSDAAHLFSQLAAAVAHLHAHGCAHRDLKMENVCLRLDDASPGHVTLIDLGAAAVCEPGEQASLSALRVGTACASVAAHL